MKTLFITGSSGVIGREVTGILLQKGYNIIGTDKNPSPFNGAPNFKFLQADITDKAKIAPILEAGKIDALIHLACSVDNDIPATVDRKEEDDCKNVDKYIYKSAITGGIKDIILLSTTQIYAPQKTREPVRETYDEKPSTVYAKMKYESEKALLSLTKKGEARATIMRVAPVYSKSYIPNLHDRIFDYKENTAFLVRDGEYGTTFCCIYNIVDFISGILSQDGSYHYEGIYNVCDTKPTTAKEIAMFEREFHNLGNVVQKASVNNSANGPKKPKNDYRYVDFGDLLSNHSIDNTKAQRIATFRWKLANTK